MDKKNGTKNILRWIAAFPAAVAAGVVTALPVAFLCAALHVPAALVTPFVAWVVFALVFVWIAPDKAKGTKVSSWISWVCFAVAFLTNKYQIEQSIAGGTPRDQAGDQYMMMLAGMFVGIVAGQLYLVTQAKKAAGAVGVGAGLAKL